MTDDEKIMEKAKAFSQTRGVLTKDFVAAVAWRDANPGPRLKELQLELERLTFECGKERVRRQEAERALAYSEGR